MNPNYFSTDFVKKLSFPRLVGTEGEKKSQALIETELKALKIDNYEKSDFTYTTTFMDVLLRIYDFLIGLIIISIILTLLLEIYYLAIILSIILLITAFFSRQIREKIQFKLLKIGKKRNSCNYIIKFPANEKDLDKCQNIIIFAHYDSISHSVNPIFSGVLFFFSLVGGTFFALHVLIIVLLFLLSFIPSIDVMWFLYGFFLAGFISLQLLNSRHSKSYGTIDNATGVANSFYLMEYFRENPLEYTNLIIVLTGAEEMGDAGAYFYVLRNNKNIDKKNSYFFIIDSVGGNKNKNLYFYAQGLPKKQFSPIIRKNIESLLNNQKESLYKIAPVYIPPLIHFSTDHAPLKPYGYEFMIFGSSGSIHSAKDNIENYSSDLLENFNEFSRDLIIHMDSNWKND